jgi:hypothetical protein
MQQKKGVPPTDYPMMTVRVSYDPELEAWPVVKLPLGDRAKNAIGRVGLTTVGEIMDNWDKLTILPARRIVEPGLKAGSSGLGAKSAREVRAAVFALLCSEAKVNLAIDVEGLT